MKKILYGITILALAAMSAGCNKSTFHEVGVGTASFKVAATGDYTTKATAVDPTTFKAKITRKADGNVLNYNSVAEMPAAIELQATDYTIDVVSPNTLPAAFDQPVYGGSKDFTVKVGQNVPVSIDASLQNVKVTLKPDPNFLKELASFTVTVSNGDAPENTLTWGKTDVEAGAKAGYFAVAPVLKIHVDGYRSFDSVPASFDGSITNPSAKDHYIITLKANTTGQLGGITITVDTTTNDKPQDIIVPGFDETPVPGDPTPGPTPPDPAPDPQPETPQPETPQVAAPTLEWPTNPSFATMEIVEDMNVDLVVKTPGKIKDFVVTVSDNFKPAIVVIASPDGKVSDMDLINNQYLIDMLAGIAPTLPTKEKLLGQTEVQFPLSELIPMISEVGEVGQDYVFTLNVTDELGQKLTKSLTFHLKTLPQAQA